jgi:hypothetical protein
MVQHHHETGSVKWGVHMHPLCWGWRRGDERVCSCTASKGLCCQPVAEPQAERRAAGVCVCCPRRGRGGGLECAVVDCEQGSVLSSLELNHKVWENG